MWPLSDQYHSGGGNIVIGAERDAYWSYAQCVTWICTRDLQRVKKILDPQSSEAVSRAYRRFMLEEYVPLKADGRLENELMVLADQDFAGVLPGEAHHELFEACLNNRVVVRGLHHEASTFKQIPPAEFVDLEFRIRPRHPVAECWLWLRSRGEFVWTFVQFLRDDVIREWPPEARRVKDDTTVIHAISSHLMKIMIPGDLLTKDRAWERCWDEIPGATRGRFEVAWKRLPPGRKRGRGKHGRRAH